jgi:hypothetical protein
MIVDISTGELTVERVWFDATCGRLFIQAGGYVNGIAFDQIPDSDFESSAPVTAFTVGQSGTVIVCRHRDGNETWLPVDMWQPGGFSGKVD